MSNQSRLSEPERFNAVNRGVYISDNLPFLKSLNSDSIDLVIIDPPFGKNQTFSGTISPQLTQQERRVETGLLDSWGITDIDGAYDRGIEYPDQEGQTAKFSDIWRFERIMDAGWWDEERLSDTAVYWLIESTRRTHGNSTAAYIAFMARRMAEVRRVLNPTGSVYLHCDYAANAYLRQMMDAVFGQRNFRNELVWERTTSRNDGKQFGRTHDSILYYSKTAKYTWNPVYLPLNEGGSKAYRHDDNDGKGLYSLRDVRNPRPGGFVYDLGFGEKLPKNGYCMTEELAREWLKEGRLVVKSGRVPRRKKYIHESPGVKLGSVWNDIRVLSSHAKERTGYPTQKPQALARRMIEASSNPGDIVLDCFAGCAYVPVAAETLGRRWVACDMSPRAWTIVRRQFAKKPELAMTVAGEESQYDDASPSFEGQGALRVFGPMQLPERELDDLVRRVSRQGNDLAPIGFRHIAIETSDQIWEAFVSAWDAFCWYCGTAKPKDRRELHLDHVEPNAQDGSNDDCWNRALACAPCNSDKGNRLTPQETIEKAYEAGRIGTPQRRDEMIDLFNKRQQWAKERYEGLRG